LSAAGSCKQEITHLKEGSAEVENIGAHEVLGLNGTENHNVAPNALVTENTNTAVSVKTSKGLRDLKEPKVSVDQSWHIFKLTWS
jgi:hypothetical protein